MALYVGETTLRAITLEVLRRHVPSVTGIRIARRAGPFLPGNCRIAWLDVLVADYGAARDMADRLEAGDSWIMVPDAHPLDGQVFDDNTQRA